MGSEGRVLRRMIGIVAAGAVLALGLVDRAFAVAPEQAPGAPDAARHSHAVAARAHLVYRPGVNEGKFEGALTVVEQRAAPDPGSVDNGGVRYLILTHTSDASSPAEGKAEPQI